MPYLCFARPSLGETEDWRDFIVIIIIFWPCEGVSCPPQHLGWVIFGNQDPILHKEEKDKGITPQFEGIGGLWNHCLTGTVIDTSTKSCVSREQRRPQGAQETQT